MSQPHRGVPERWPRLTTRAVWAVVLPALLVLGTEPCAATSPSAATGMLVAVRGQALVDGNTFTIDDGAGLTKTFEFDSNGSTTTGNVAVTFAGTDNANLIAIRITTAVNSTDLAVTATQTGTAAVSLVNDSEGSAGNVPMFENVTAPEFMAFGMTGGTDPDTPQVAAASTGVVVALRAQWLVDGETFTIDDGAGLTRTIEFDGNGSVSAGNVAVPFGPTDNAIVLANWIATAINATPLAITASAGSAAVWLVNDHEGLAGNVPIQENVAALEFTVAGMSGGTDETVAVAPGSVAADQGVRAFPNPFRATTLIELGAHARRPGLLRVLDVHGSVLRVFATRDGLPSRIRWDGLDAHGRALPPGVYLYEVTSAGAPPATGRFIKLR